MRNILLISALVLVAPFVIYSQATSLLTKFSTESLMMPTGGEFSRHRTGVLAVSPLDFEDGSRLRLELFNDVSCDVRLERRPVTHPAGNLDVYWGTSGDPAWSHLPWYRNVVLVINRSTGRLILYAIISGRTFLVTSMADQDHYDIYQSAAMDQEMSWACSDTGGSAGFRTGKVSVGAGCSERDSSGTYVVDVFFSYCHEAEAAVGDIYAHAAAQAEVVNQCLSNSLVNNVYLRAVDLAVRDNWTGLIADALLPNLDLYETEMEAVGADILADFQTYKPSVSNSGGWAYTPGRTNSNWVRLPNVLSHEWAHNTGSGHCGGRVSPYAAGYNNGNVGTIMCRSYFVENSNFYSNPSITDAMGVPIGDALTADNARSIRERASVISGYRTHLIPFDEQDTGDCPDGLPDGVYYIRNAATGQYLTASSVGDPGDLLTLSGTNAALKDGWEVHHFGQGRTMIYNRAGNTAITVVDSSTFVGQQIGLRTSEGSDDQLFYLLPAGNNGNYFIRAGINALSLTVDQNNTEEGDTVWQDQLDGSAFDEWGFIPVMDAPPVVSVSTTATTTPCSNSATGMAIVTVAGDSNPGILWETGSSNDTLFDLVSGNYELTVTSGGSSYFVTANVRTRAAMFVELDIVRATQLQGGSVAITNVANGTGPFTYAWSDGDATDSVRHNLEAGDYTVTVTNAVGCWEARNVRVAKSLAIGEYYMQHVASGLFAVEGEPNVVLTDCPTGNSRARWQSTDEGGIITKLRNVQSGRVVSASNSGPGTRLITSPDNNSRFHKYGMIAVGADTWRLRHQVEGMFTSATNATVGSSLTLEEQLSGEADEWRFLPAFNCASLPVNLLSFTGTVRSKSNLLRWSTVSESGNAGFYVQRSTNGISFTDLGFMPGAERSSDRLDYEFSDELPLPGTALYRLRQVDLDGTETISTIVTLTRTDEVTWSVYPNPLRSGAQLTVSLLLVDLSVYDLSGRLMQRIHQRNFTLGSLPAGIYLLRNEADGTVRRLVKLE